MFTGNNTTMAENVRRDNKGEDRGLQSVCDDCEVWECMSWGMRNHVKGMLRCEFAANWMTSQCYDESVLSTR